jgi:hypothetical protein
MSLTGHDKSQISPPVPSHSGAADERDRPDVNFNGDGREAMPVYQRCFSGEVLVNVSQR